MAEEWEWERAPDPHRPVIDATQASAILKLGTYRTLVARIKRGKFKAGGKYPGKKRWWVYADALPGNHNLRPAPPTPASTAGQPQQASTQDALINQLQGQLRVHKQRQAELLAACSAANDASDSYRDSADLILEAIRDNQTVLDKALRAAAGFQRSADQFREEAGHYRNILAEMSIPDDLADFDLG